MIPGPGGFLATGATSFTNAPPVAARRRGAGLAWCERAEQTNREELANKALELLDRAIAARPGDAEAAWAHSKLAAKLRR